jgi:dopamine beta-monooxygenase
MQLLLSSLVLTSLLYGASALIDCGVTSKAAGDFDSGWVPACNYFQGVNHESYLEWYETQVAGKYANHAFLQGSDPDKPEDGAAVHWRVDEEHIYIGVAARATGWAAFGISEVGGMTGTDMVIFTASRPDELVDAYTGEERFPQTDNCSSDWEMVASNIDLEGGFIMFETKRLLDTNDPQDKPIRNDTSILFPPHRVIAAWGDSEEVSYHGQNRARGTFRFFGTGDEDSTFKAAMDVAEGYVDILAGNYSVPAQETTYALFCFSRQDLIDQGLLDTTDSLNIIGWEPLVQPGNEPHVHHYIVTASTQPFCNTTDDSVSTDFMEMAYIWAPGEKVIAFPDFLGMPLFGSDGFQAFQMEIHYNNPTLTEGVIDNSGVRFYWTSEQREQQIGIMNIGDPLIGVFGQPLGVGLSMHQFECPGSCSSLASQEVTVLREYLHMHETGLRITNEQIRDGEVVRKGNIDHWDFHQNGDAAVQQDEFVVKPGDSFRTTCYYEDSTGAKTFGIGSSEEMCMAFLYYYPRQKFDLGGGFESPWYCGYDLPIPPCQATYEKRTLVSDDEVGREYAVANTACEGVATTPPSDELVEGDSGCYPPPSTLGLAGIIGTIGGLMVV